MIGILTPWNAPLLQITQKASQALIVGNSVVVKPSPLACFSTLFAQLAKQAGLPDGLLNIVTGGPSSGSQIVKHKLIKKNNFYWLISDWENNCGRVRGAWGISVVRVRG